MTNDVAVEDVNESEQQILKEAANNALDAVQLEVNGLTAGEPELDAPARDESKVEVTNKPESDELSVTIASHVEAHSAVQTSSTIGDDASQESQHEDLQPSLPPSISSATDFAMIDMASDSNATCEGSQLDKQADMRVPTTMSEDVLIEDQAEAPTDLDTLQVPADDNMTVEETADDAPVDVDQAGAEHMDILQPATEDIMNVEDPEGDVPVDMDQSEAEHGMSDEEATFDAIDIESTEAAPEDAMEGKQDTDAPEDMDIPEATAEDGMSETDSDAPFEMESMEAATDDGMNEGEVLDAPPIDGEPLEGANGVNDMEETNSDSPSPSAEEAMNNAATEKVEHDKAPAYISDWEEKAETARQETLEYLKQAREVIDRTAVESAAAPTDNYLSMALQGNSFADRAGYMPLFDNAETGTWTSPPAQQQLHNFTDQPLAPPPPISNYQLPFEDRSPPFPAVAPWVPPGEDANGGSGAFATAETDTWSLPPAHQEWYANLAQPLPQAPFPAGGDAQEVTLQSGMDAASAAERAARLEHEVTILTDYVTAIRTHGQIPSPYQPLVAQNSDGAYGIDPSFGPAVPLGFNVHGYHPLPGYVPPYEAQPQVDAGYYDVGQIQQELPEFDYGNLDPALGPFTRTEEGYQQEWVDPTTQPLAPPPPTSNFRLPIEDHSPPMVGVEPFIAPAEVLEGGELSLRQIQARFATLDAEEAAARAEEDGSWLTNYLSTLPLPAEYATSGEPEVWTPPAFIPDGGNLHSIVDHREMDNTHDNDYRAPPLSQPEHWDPAALAERDRLETARIIEAEIERRRQAEEQRTREFSSEATSTSGLSSPPQQDSRVIIGNRKGSGKAFKASRPKPLATTPSATVGTSQEGSFEEEAGGSELKTTDGEPVYNGDGDYSALARAFPC